ncbi:MAG: outer membrane protein assembly factor BamE [Roseinatronobacter sp.]|nr:MAG: outer membrane protein assembly factor BamE [Roseinatronobacter sp.]
MRIFNITAAIIASAALAGCLDGDFGQPISQEVRTDAELADQIKIGSSRRADVQALLGEPVMRQRTGGREYWSYQYDTRLTNLAMYVPVVQMVAGRGGHQTNTVVVVFDGAGVVRDVITSCARASGGILTETEVTDDC